MDPIASGLRGRHQSCSSSRTSSPLWLRRCPRAPDAKRQTPFERFVEAGLHLVEIGVECRLERRVGIEAVGVRAQQLVHAGGTIRINNVFDDHDPWKYAMLIFRGSVKAALRSRSLMTLSPLTIAGELDVHLPGPFRPRLLLLVLGNAFGEPPRNTLVRHLNRDDVGQLVPQRRFPLERSGSLALGESIATTRPKHTPSAPIMPGRPSIPDREVVVLREHLDENRSLILEFVALGEGIQRLVRERNRVSWRTAASLLSNLKMRSPSLTVTNVSSLSSIPSILNVGL